MLIYSPRAATQNATFKKESVILSTVHVLRTAYSAFCVPRTQYAHTHHFAHMIIRLKHFIICFLAERKKTEIENTPIKQTDRMDKTM